MGPVKDKIAILQANLERFMNRIFHVKITIGTYTFLFLFSAIMILAFWYKESVAGLVMALALIVTIESIIHSTYTLTTEGNLVVYRGRFLKTRVVPFTDITDIELMRGSGLGGMMTSSYILVHHGDKKQMSLVPVKPKEFMNVLVKRLENRIEEE